MTTAIWFLVGWSVLLLGAGFLAGIGYAWRFAGMIYYERLRAITPFDLAIWQRKDQQRRVDARDRRP